MAPRKTQEVQVTPSRDAILAALGTELWTGKLYVEPTIPEGTSEADANKLRAKAYDDATDAVAVLFRHLRKIRDDSKPVLRERKDTADVIAESIGKPVSELQAAFIQLPLTFKEDGSPDYVERVSIPSLRKFSELVDHPFHLAAIKFTESKGIRFIQREKAKGGKGKAAVVLEAAPKGKTPKTGRNETQVAA